MSSTELPPPPVASAPPPPPPPPPTITATAAPPPPPVAGTGYVRISTAAALTLFGAAVMAAGVLGPWVDAVIVSRSGLSTPDGKMVGGLALVIALLALQSGGVGTGGRVLIFLFGVFAAVVGAFDLADVTERFGTEGIASPGWGLYAVMAGGVIAAVSALNSAWKRQL